MCPRLSKGVRETRAAERAQQQRRNWQGRHLGGELTRGYRSSGLRVSQDGSAHDTRMTVDMCRGAQQRLTAVLLTLGRARESTEKRDALLVEAIEQLATGLDELRELAAGLHPSVLSERGLGAALEALALRNPVPIQLIAQPDGRLPPRIEAAAYYVVAEAVANVQKHASADGIVVRVTSETRRVLVEVTDDGVGGANPDGAGLRGLADRVEALGGKLVVESPRGVGTRLLAEIPTG